MNIAPLQKVIDQLLNELATFQPSEIKDGRNICVEVAGTLYGITTGGMGANEARRHIEKIKTLREVETDRDGWPLN